MNKQAKSIMKQLAEKGSIEISVYEPKMSKAAAFLSSCKMVKIETVGKKMIVTPVAS